MIVQKSDKSQIIEHDKESSTRESINPKNEIHQTQANHLNFSPQTPNFTNVESKYSPRKVTLEKSDFNKTLEIFNNQNSTVLHSGIRRGFGKHSRALIFILLTFTNIMINFDHGAIPASSTNLMRELNLDSLSLGILGSLVFLGLTFGASAAGFLFSTYAPKWIVTLSLFSSSFFLYLFTQGTTLLTLSLYRFLCGFSQVFSMIYFPVWVDQFGVMESRTMWLAYLQLGSPLGTMLGYVTSAFSLRLYSNWKIPFYVQSFFIAISAIILSITPDKFFSRYYRRTDMTRQLKNELTQIYGNDDISVSKDYWQKFHVINGHKYSRLSDFSIFSLKDEYEENKQTHYLSILSSLITNKIYTFTMLTICCLLFIITGIEFWISDYMKVIMEINERKVYITFAIVCITAPTLGVLSGGYITEQLGGYTDKKALDSSYQIAMMAAICGLPLPIINNFLIFVLLMWLTLFFGGSLVPGLTGIMLNSIPLEYKEVANSHTHFCYNLIGYLPAPFLYGVIYTYIGARFALSFIMITSLLGLLFLHYAMKYQQNAEIDITNQNDELIETYLNHKNTNDYRINHNNPMIKTQAINALYGRISMAQSN
jgi:MFS transporter, Spinster family, sphingosine-1-phosphate transporter